MIAASKRALVFASWLALVASACGEGTTGPGEIGLPGFDASVPDAPPPEPDAGTEPDAAPLPDATVDPMRPDNDRRDTDCDGLSDRDELATIWASGVKTDASSPDSDGDGLTDGLEAGRTSSVDPGCAGRFTGDAEPSSHTDPTRADTDGDGLDDGAEDVNRDGRVDPMQETDPELADTDGDGFCDGPTTIPGLCTGGDPTPIPTEPDGDADCDGLSNRAERALGTDPHSSDTDEDGLTDGIEAGVMMPFDPVACPATELDLDPTTTTDPVLPDSDADGIPDGAEDTNQDGVLDPGELDPRDPTDGITDPTVGAACALQSLVPVDRARDYPPDLQIVTATRAMDAFTETSELRDSARAGRVVGRTAHHPGHAIAYLALTTTPTAADVVGHELAVRGVLASVAPLTVPITRTFTTWDGYPAVHAEYHLAGDVGVKTRLDAIARALLPTISGTLPATGEVIAQGGFRVEAELVMRSARSVVTMIALIPAQQDTGAAALTIGDLAGGSALGQFGDSLGVQCDRFVTQPYAKLDILWAVDNSVSMSDEQGAVGASASALDARLSNAPIDWRVAVVSSGFWRPGTGTGCTNATCGDTLREQCRPFTTDLGRFSRWFTNTSTIWIGAGGPCNQPREEIIRGAQLMLTTPPPGATASFMPPLAAPDAMHLRDGTNLVLILMGDADDQFYTDAQAAMGITEYEAFFRALPVASVTMGGILCPDGEACGETQRTPRVALGLVNRFGGVIGSLRDLPSIAPTVEAIIDAAVGGTSPYVLSKSAIASTIKVAMEPGSTVGPCRWDDVPRDRTNGFDYDAQSRTIAFFGDCRPSATQTGRPFSISYRYWNDETPSPDQTACTTCGDCPGVARCDLETCLCTCDRTVTCGPGFAFDDAACDCTCSEAALACDATHGADTDLCACVCLDDCGGCAADEVCNASLCACVPRNI
ncbi:hypothetical protein L6R52_24515 [Myxococcota bacterium]|nr:hypothetical protein [Myxococcota bacterium]